MCASRQMPEEAELNFIHYLKRRDASPNTIKSCLASCRLYYSLFGELNTTNLMLYKDYLVQHYTAATVNNRIYGINRYLDCIGMALDNKGPDSDGSRAASDNTGFPSDCHRDSRDAFRLPVVQTQQVSFLDRVISQEDYMRFKDSLKSDGNMYWYFVVRFLACTGARVSELIQIKAEHLEMGYMDLCLKGGKVRRIYFPDALCQEALDWVHEKGVVSGFLFTNSHGDPITPRGISSQLKVLARRYGIPEDTVYPHAFRHRFAKNFLANFNDISLLADLMGHDSIETTRIYLNKSTDEQRELIDKIVTW